MNVLKENERLITDLAKQKAQNERLLQENLELKNVLKQNGLIARYYLDKYYQNIYIIAYYNVLLNIFKKFF